MVCWCVVLRVVVFALVFALVVVSVVVAASLCGAGASPHVEVVYAVRASVVVDGGAAVDISGCAGVLLLALWDVLCCGGGV